MQRAAQWNKPLYEPEFSKVRSLDFSKVDVDPAYGCEHPGDIHGGRTSRPDRSERQSIWLMNSVENALRILPLDARQAGSAE